MVNLTTAILKGRYLSLVPVIVTYAELYYIEYLSQTSVSIFKGQNTSSGALWCYISNWRASQVFHVGKVDFLQEKLSFWAAAANKTAPAIVWDLVWGGYICGRGDEATVCWYWWWRQ